MYSGDFYINKTLECSTQRQKTLFYVGDPVFVIYEHFPCGLVICQLHWRFLAVQMQCRTSSLSFKFNLPFHSLMVLTLFNLHFTSHFFMAHGPICEWRMLSFLALLGSTRSLKFLLTNSSHIFSLSKISSTWHHLIYMLIFTRKNILPILFFLHSLLSNQLKNLQLMPPYKQLHWTESLLIRDEWALDTKAPLHFIYLCRKPINLYHLILFKTAPCPWPDVS